MTLDWLTWETCHCIPWVHLSTKLKRCFITKWHECGLYFCMMHQRKVPVHKMWSCFTICFIEYTNYSCREDVEDDDLKETKGYWSLKQEAPDCALWRTHLGWGNGPVIRQINEWTNDCLLLVLLLYLRTAIVCGTQKKNKVLPRIGYEDSEGG